MWKHSHLAERAERKTLSGNTYDLEVTVGDGKVSEHRQAQISTYTPYNKYLAV